MRMYFGRYGYEGEGEAMTKSIVVDVHVAIHDHADARRVRIANRISEIKF